MVTNGVTNMPMDGFPKPEVSKSSKANNQFANALETKPANNSVLSEKPVQNGPTGISALYNDDHGQPPTITERAHQAWGFAREVVNGFVNPGQPDNTMDVPVVKGNQALAVVTPPDSKPAGNEINVDNDTKAAIPTVTATTPTPEEDVDSEEDVDTEDETPTQAEKFYGKYHQKSTPATAKDTQDDTDTVPQYNGNGNAPIVMLSTTDDDKGNGTQTSHSGQSGGQGNQSVTNEEGPVIDPNTGLPIVNDEWNPGNDQWFTWNSNNNNNNGYPQEIDPATGLPIGSPPQLSNLFQQVDQVGQWPVLSFSNNSYQPWDQPWQGQPSPFTLPNPQENYYFPPLPQISGNNGQGQTWSQGLYSDILGNYFGGVVPTGGSSSTAGLEFAPGFF